MRSATSAILAVVFAGVTAAGLAASAGFEKHDPLRGPVRIDEATRPLPLATTENKDVKRTRAWPMQPPTIPHSIDNYQIDRFANRCVMCHSRAKAAESQATPISATHYTDRDGNFLADIAPRRYFCDTCHVVQTEARLELTVPNTFEDAESVVRRTQAQGKPPLKKK